MSGFASHICLVCCICLISFELTGLCLLIYFFKLYVLICGCAFGSDSSCLSWCHLESSLSGLSALSRE